MSQGEKTPSKGWLKNVLRFMFFLIFLFLVLIVVGVFAAEYLQDIDIRGWIIKTQWLWFPVRLILYGLIGVIVLSLSRRHPASMPTKAKWLIAMVLIFAEAITQITLS